MIISTANANPVLTATLSLFMVDPAGFAGRALAPLFMTKEQSAKYYIFDRANLLNSPKRLDRAPSTPYPRTTLSLSDDSYNCTNKGIEIPVDDEERAKYSVAFSADEAAMRRARNIILINHETRVKNASTAAGVPHATPGTKWDNYSSSSSDPVGDVDVGKTNIHENCGMEANLMVLPRAVFLKLKEHPKILDKIKYSQRGIITPELLAEVFNIERIVIAGALDNAAADGQALNPGYIWDDNIVLAHVEDSQDMQAPNFMRTFAWTAQTGPDGVLVESYREDNIQSDIHRAKQYTDEKVVGSFLGYNIKDVLT